MAKYFSGMSKDSFVDSLVEKTGLNGHELYNYLEKLIENNPAEKKEEKKKPETIPIGAYTFCGNTKEAQEFYLAHGGDPFVAKYFVSMVPGLAAVNMASAMGVERFEWIRPTKAYYINGGVKNIQVRYSAWYVPETGKYNCDDGEVL